MLPPHPCLVRGASSPPCLVSQPLTPPLLPDSLSLLVVALDLPATLLLLAFFKDGHLRVCTPSPLPFTSRHPGPTHPLIADSADGFQFLSFSRTSVWDSWLLKWHSVLVITGASSWSGQFLLLCLLLSAVLTSLLFSSAPLCGLLNAPVSYSQPPPPHCCCEQSLSFLHPNPLQASSDLYARKYKTTVSPPVFLFSFQGLGQGNKWSPAAHSSILAWRSLAGFGPQGRRVGHDLARTKHEMYSPFLLRQIDFQEDLEDHIQIVDSWPFPSWVLAVPENGPPAEPASLPASAVRPPPAVSCCCGPPLWRTPQRASARCFRGPWGVLGAPGGVFPGPCAHRRERGLVDEGRPSRRQPACFPSRWCLLPSLGPCSPSNACSSFRIWFLQALSFSALFNTLILDLIYSAPSRV